jgi:hypothetical protein
MDVISLIKSNTRVLLDEQSESGFSPCGRDRPKGDSEVKADEERVPFCRAKKGRCPGPHQRALPFGIPKKIAVQFIKLHGYFRNDNSRNYKLILIYEFTLIKIA